MKYHLLPILHGGRQDLTIALESAPTANRRKNRCLARCSAANLTKFLCSLILCHVVVLASSPAFAESRYGSIVFSQESGGGYAWGMAWSYDSRSSARKRAISECRSRNGTGCGEISWFRDACGALAIGDNNGYGSGWGTSISLAEDYALQSCRNANRNCRITISRCAR